MRQAQLAVLLILCWLGSAGGQKTGDGSGSEGQDYCQSKYGFGSIYDDKNNQCLCPPGLVFDGDRCVLPGLQHGAAKIPALSAGATGGQVASSSLTQREDTSMVPTGSWNPKEVEDQFGSLDMNRDGRLVVEELAGKMIGPGGGAAAESDDAYKASLKAARSIFVDMDRGRSCPDRYNTGP